MAEELEEEEEEQLEEQRMPEHTPAPTPHRAIYGFAFCVLFASLGAVFFIWALVPQSILGDRLGLTYMPDKYFVLLLAPVVWMALTLFAFVVYPAMNLAITLDATDARTVRDAASVRRCGWRMAGAEDGRRCGRRVADRRVAEGWAVVELCERHWQADGRKTDLEEEEERRIDDWCDCADRQRCVLQRRPQHVGELLALRAVPSVCDLDVSEVSRNLFGSGRGRNRLNSQ